jgi:glycerophosphoryl diester phosphodiesterase
MALLSAHRCGAGNDHDLENTRLALERCIELECEYVEFDVQRCQDGTLVLYHDDHVEIDGRAVPLSDLTLEAFAATTRLFIAYDEALGILRGRKRAHIDFKFASPKDAVGDPETTPEIVATQMAIDRLGADHVIITSLEDHSIRLIREWSRERYPALLVGLSFGRDMTGTRLAEHVGTRISEVFPERRLLACDANLVVANRRLAEVSLARFAARRSLPLLVWTVDEPDDLARWFADPRVWIITSNFPRRAAAVRRAIAG